jgi:hypothetical protein
MSFLPITARTRSEDRPCGIQNGTRESALLELVAQNDAVAWRYPSVRGRNGVGICAGRMRADL